MVSGGGGAYLISGNSGAAAVTVEEAAAAAANMTHATRVSQATVSKTQFLSFSDIIDQHFLFVYYYMNHYFENRLDVYIFINLFYGISSDKMIYGYMIDKLEKRILSINSFICLLGRIYFKSNFDKILLFPL